MALMDPEKRQLVVFLLAPQLLREAAGRFPDCTSQEDASLNQLKNICKNVSPAVAITIEILPSLVLYQPKHFA